MKSSTLTCYVFTALNALVTLLKFVFSLFSISVIPCLGVVRIRWGLRSDTLHSHFNSEQQHPNDSLARVRATGQGRLTGFFYKGTRERDPGE